MLMTEIEQGQKAALNLDLNPYRAQAELERIPLETQKLQQTLETGKTTQATAALQLRALLSEEQSNTQFKTAVEQMVKSGGLDSTRPISEQALKLSQIAYGQGNFDLGRKFSADGERATQHEAQAEVNTYKIGQRKLETLGTLLKTLAPDGSDLDSAINSGIKLKLLPPEQLESFREQGKQAIAISPAAYTAWQAGLTKKLRTHEQEKIAVEEAKLAAKIIEDEKKDKLNTRRFEALLSQRGAARTSGDDRAAVRLDTNMLASARRQLEYITDDIRDVDRELAKLPPKPTTTEWLSSKVVADPNAEARKELLDRKTILKERQEKYAKEEAEALKNLRKDGGKDKTSEPKTNDAPPASFTPEGRNTFDTRPASPNVAAPTAPATSGLIRPADVPRDWVVRQDGKGNRAWVSPDGKQFKEITR